MREIACALAFLYLLVGIATAGRRYDRKENVLNRTLEAFWCGLLRPITFLVKAFD
jgi:hypothetical protein